MRKLLVLSPLVSALILLTAVQAHALRYTMTRLGAYAPDSSGNLVSFAEAVNDQGDVAGITTFSGDISYSAFIWDSVGGMQLLPFPSGFLSMPPGVVGMNNQRQVAGTVRYVLYEGSSQYNVAVLWDGAMVTPIVAFPQAWPISYAVDINEAGQVLAQQDIYSFIWNKGQKTLITPGMRGTALNDGGRVIGVVQRLDMPIANYHEIALWENGTMTRLGLPQGYFRAWANDINNLGQVAGRASIYRDNNGDGYFREVHEGFIYDAGTWTMIGPNVPVTLNDTGQAIGYPANWGLGAPFIWDAVNGVRPLRDFVDDADCPLHRVTAINSLGQISGSCQREIIPVPPDGGPPRPPKVVQEAVLLTPDPPLDTDVDGDGWRAFQDCDDHDSSIHPGGVETVGDGIDQDCNGMDMSIVVREMSWSRRRKTLVIRAESAYGGNAQLSVKEYGLPLIWDAATAQWTLVLRKVRNPPASLTVTGPEGSVTAGVGIVR